MHVNPNNPTKCVLVLSPFDRWKNWLLERPRRLPKVTQLWNETRGIKFRSAWFQTLVFIANCLSNTNIRKEHSRRALLHTRSTANHVNTLSHLTLILTLKGGLIVLILEMRKWAQKAKLLVGSHYINKRVAGQGFKSRSVTKWHQNILVSFLGGAQQLSSGLPLGAQQQGGEGWPGWPYSY